MDMSPLLDENLLAAQNERRQLRLQFRDISDKMKAAAEVAHEKEKAAWANILRTADLDNVEDLLLVTNAMAEIGGGASMCESFLNGWVKKKSRMLNVDLVWNNGSSPKNEERYFYLPQIQLELSKNATIEEKAELESALLYFHELFLPFEKDYTFTFFEKSFGGKGDFIMKIMDPLTAKVFKGPHDIFSGSLNEAVHYCCARIYY